MTRTRILLAGYHGIVRGCLRRLLDERTGWYVVGEAGDGQEAVRMARELLPDIVVMDAAPAPLDGLEATRQIVTGGAGTRVVVLTSCVEEGFVEDMLQAGASGYLLKDCSFDDLSRAIATVAGGQVYLDPRVAHIVVQACMRSRERQVASRGLSVREREVLQLLAEGNRTRQIAGTLGLSVKTIETHRRQMMERLGIYNVPGLTKYALRQGLTSLPT